MATSYDTWKTTEPVNDEAEFVAKRRGELAEEWRKDLGSVKDVIADLLSDDGDDYFATKLADFVIAYEKAHARGDSNAALRDELLASFSLHRAIEHLITERFEREAEVCAQADWDQSRKDPRD
jgi:hypothetical protein